MPLKPGSIIKTNDFLAANDYIQSSNRLFYAVMQDDGNFCVYRGIPGHQHRQLYGTIQSGRQKPATGKKFWIQMQDDGNFCLYKGTHPDASDPIWDHHKIQPRGKFYAQMQDDGNFVVYKGTDPQARDAHGVAIWDTHAIDHPKEVALDSKSIIKYHMDKAETQIAGQWIFTSRPWIISAARSTSQAR